MNNYKCQKSEIVQKIVLAKDVDCSIDQSKRNVDLLKLEAVSREQERERESEELRKKDLIQQKSMKKEKDDQEQEKEKPPEAGIVKKVNTHPCRRRSVPTTYPHLARRSLPRKLSTSLTGCTASPRNTNPTHCLSSPSPRTLTRWYSRPTSMQGGA